VDGDHEVKLMVNKGKIRHLAQRGTVLSLHCEGGDSIGLGKKKNNSTSKRYVREASKWVTVYLEKG